MLSRERIDVRCEMSSNHNQIYSVIKCDKVIYSLISIVCISFLCGVIFCGCAELQDATGKTLDSANVLMYPNKTQSETQELGADEQETLSDSGYGEPMLASDDIAGGNVESASGGNAGVNNADKDKSANKNPNSGTKSNNIEQSAGKVLDNAGSVMNYGVGRMFRTK